LKDLKAYITKTQKLLTITEERRIKINYRLSNDKLDSNILKIKLGRERMTLEY